MARILLTSTLVAMLLAGGGAIALAQMAAPTRAGPAPITGYLPMDTGVDGAALIGPPPAPDSPSGRADRAAYDDSRALAGSAAWKQAIIDDSLVSPTGIRSFSCAVGTAIGPDETPVLARLMSRMARDTSAVARAGKLKYQRPRPAMGNDQPICLAREAWLGEDPSYPSGSGAVGWAWSLVLAELSPTRAQPILARGLEIGDGRVICGVHYPSDIQAGRLIGAAVVSRLHADAAFKADLEAARAEIAVSRSKGPAAGCSAGS
jgi:acid phosphatase (class A)